MNDFSPSEAMRIRMKRFSNHRESKKKFQDSIGFTYSGNQVTYKCPIPRGIGSLLIVGRCASYARDILNPMRMISTCITTGQASGIAAALASKKNVSARSLSVALQQELERQNVKL